MNPRNTARIVGILFITATVTYMLGSGYLDPILYAPDYVLNAGGIINAYREAIRLARRDAQGYDETWAREQVEQIANTLNDVFETAEREAITPNRAAENMVDAILSKARPRST